MTRLLLYTIVLLCSLPCLSQGKSEFSLQINYGLTGNFFVNDYNEDYSPSSYHKYFYKKNFIGSIAGVYADYHISPVSFFLIEYSRSINSDRKSYYKDANGTEIYIKDFKLRYINNFFQLGYGHDIKLKNFLLKTDVGPVLLYTSDQSITMDDLNSISIRESKYTSFNSVEGGVFFGLGCTRKIDTKFDIGIKARVYYMISLGVLEAVTLTPTLTYRF